MRASECGRGRDLMVPLFDQFIANSGACAETGFDLGGGMVPWPGHDKKIRACTVRSATRKKEQRYGNCGIEVSQR